MTEHGDKVAAVRRRTVELSQLPHEEIVAIEAGIKNPNEFPTLDAEQYLGVSLEGVVTADAPSDAHVLRFLAGHQFDEEQASLHMMREQRWRIVDRLVRVGPGLAEVLL